MTKKQIKLEEENDAKEDFVKENPGMAERQKILDDKKLAREQLAKDKKDAPTEKEVEDMLFFEMIDSYRGFKDDKGKELEFNEENTRLLLEAPYIRHLIEEVSSKMGNFSTK